MQVRSKLKLTALESNDLIASAAGLFEQDTNTMKRHSQQTRWELRHDEIL